MLTVGEILKTEQASGWVGFDDHNLVKRMSKAFKFPCETTRTRIDDNQDSKEGTWSEQETHQSF
jgi:hypothetical protein